MQRTIFQPLGMSHSSFQWTPALGSQLATFYAVDSKPATHYRFTALAAASLYTSASDLTLFIQAHLPGPRGEPVGRGVLEPETIEEMWRPHASRMGQDIWGLGTILYASNDEGGFVVGHDGNNDPAINTAARLNPATGNAIVLLETGNPLLATKIAGEWVFWETGNVDLLTLAMSAPRMFRIVGCGAVVILLAGLIAAWRMRRAPRLGAGCT
jgi:CubicO group peptidase (beta-lactamase class C family)